MTRPLAELIDSVSPFKLDTAMQCLAKFNYRYVERLRGPERSTIVVGKALDSVSNTTYRKKIDEPDRTLPAKDVADRFAAEFDYLAMAVDEWQDDRGELLDKGVAASKVWRNSIAQFVMPFDVQPKVSVDLTDPIDGSHFTLSGYPDTLANIHSVNTVVDLKAPGRRYNASKLTKETQPVAYTLITGIPRFEFHVVTAAKTPQAQVLGATISDDHRDFFVRRAGMIRRAIANAYTTGDWIPNRGHMLCSRRWCDYWERCQQDFGGEVSP